MKLFIILALVLLAGCAAPPGGAIYSHDYGAISNDYQRSLVLDHQFNDWNQYQTDRAFDRIYEDAHRQIQATEDFYNSKQ